MRIESFSDIDVRRAAHALHGAGYHFVPCAARREASAPPLEGTERGASDIDNWFARFGNFNLAIHAGRSSVLVLDADTDEAAEWIEAHCPPTPMRAVTPRGGRHYYFGAEPRPPPPSVNLFGLGLDVRSGASLIVASPSWSRKHGRRWAWEGPVLSAGELPVLPTSLVLAKPVSKPIHRSDLRPRTMAASSRIRDVTRWIMAVESVQGRAGSNQCFKVACRLVSAGFAWEEAWAQLCRWNSSGMAIPPWSEAELSHKLRDAFARK